MGDVHIKDSALQYYVINNNLPLSMVKNLQPYIKENIDKFKMILKDRNKEPVIKSGDQCDTPYECSFKRYY